MEAASIAVSPRPVALLHYAGAPVVGGVEGIMAAHARLLTAHGVPVLTFAGRGGAGPPEQPGRIVPELDSVHPEIMACQALMADGEVPLCFLEWRDRLEAILAELLAGVDVWRPDRGEVDLSAVERAVLQAHHRYSLTTVAVDPWQAASVRQRLTAVGVRMSETSFTPLNLAGMARAVLEAFSEGNLELYQHEQLLSELLLSGRAQDAEAHVAAALRAFEQEAMDWAPLRAAWQAV